jgi:hypothetical protein
MCVAVAGAVLLPVWVTFRMGLQPSYASPDCFALDGKAKVPKQPTPFFPKPLFDSGFAVQKQLAEKESNCTGSVLAATDQM